MLAWECTAYNQALLDADVSSLANRRVSLCRRFVSDMASNHNNTTSFLIPKSETKSIGYNFPSGSERTLNKLRRTKKSRLIFYIEIFLNIITSTIVYSQYHSYAVFPGFYTYHLFIQYF